MMFFFGRLQLPHPVSHIGIAGEVARGLWCSCGSGRLGRGLGWWLWGFFGQPRALDVVFGCHLLQKLLDSRHVHLHRLLDDSLVVGLWISRLL